MASNDNPAFIKALLFKVIKSFWLLYRVNKSLVSQSNVRLETRWRRAEVPELMSELIDELTLH